MNKAVITAIVASAATVVALGIPAAAYASDNPTTTVNLAVGTGPISITAASDSATLTGVTVGGSYAVSADLGTFTVADDRGTDGGDSWTATVTSTNFTDQAEGGSAADIPASTFTYTAGAPSGVVGGDSPTYTNNHGALTTGSLDAFDASGVIGAASVSWDAQISGTLPSDVVATSYSAVITSSVA